MKKLFLFLSFAFLMTAGANAQILTESFDYTAGDSVQQHSWFTVGTIFTNQIKVTAPGLDFPNYQLPGIGNAGTPPLPLRYTLAAERRRVFVQ